MGLAVFQTVDDALYHGIKSIVSDGEVASPRNIPTTELLGYAFRLLDPRARLINIKARKWNYAYALGELCWHLSCSDDLERISCYSKAWYGFSSDSSTIRSSCYGKKIFMPGSNGNSQWSNVVTLLKHDPDSRRALLVLNQDEDLFGPDVACVTTIQFIIREKKVNCIANMRSNDIILGMCYDVFFITFLQEMLASELGLNLGWYQHQVASYHLYDKHLEMAKAIIQEGTPIQREGMPPLTNPECVLAFLEIESILRTQHHLPLEKIETLPEYWRRLASPLIAKFTC